MLHILDICLQLAEKLKNPEQVNVHIQDTIQKGQYYHPQISALSSLAYGWPAITLWYTILDHIFPDQKWDQYSHEYLKLSLSEFERSNFINFSLFHGTSGLCLVTYLCSKRMTRYEQVLSKLDDFLIEQLEDFFRDCPDILSLEDYCLMDGLVGVLVYVLMRRDDPKFSYYCNKSILKLIQLVNSQKHFYGHQVNGWYVPPENILNHEERKEYPKGKYPIGLVYGILSVLNILSIAAFEGIYVEGIRESIVTLSKWLLEKEKIGPYGSHWHHTISFEEEMGERKDPIDFSRDALCCGLPAVARSLNLASRALKDDVLNKTAKEKYLHFFSKPEKEWNLMGPSFSAGRAGVLALTTHMFKDISNHSYKDKLHFLENDLKRFYSPVHPFGFQTVNVNSFDEYQWIDDPGLLDGSVGMGLSLLLLENKNSDLWTRIFLIG